jgi:hypothetical protein
MVEGGHELSGTQNRRGGRTMSETLDKRTKAGKALAERLNKETVLKNMPKLYFVEDLGMGRYRVGRTDWPGDAFQLIPKDEFEIFRKVYEQLSMPLYDLTHDDDRSLEEEIRS